MAFLDKLGATLTSVGNTIGDGANKVAGEAKIQAKLLEEKNTINNAYSNLGKAYYEAHKDDTEGEFFNTIDAINKEFANIDALKKELQELKGLKTCPQCGEAVSTDHDFCPKCGAKLKEEEVAEVVEEAGEVAEEVTEAVTETPSNVVDSAEN